MGDAPQKTDVYRYLSTATDEKRQSRRVAVDAVIGMSSYRDAAAEPDTKSQRETHTPEAAGWTTDAELVREFDRPVNVADAVSSTVAEAIGQWPEVSETPPLYRFVDVEKLNGLFKTNATDDSSLLPSAKFRFQGCQVTVLYGSSILVIIRREQ